MALNPPGAESCSNPAPLYSKRSLIASSLLTIFVVIFICFSIALFFTCLYFIIKGSKDPLLLWLFLLAIAIVINGLWIFAWKRHKKSAYTRVKIDEQGIYYFNHLSKKTTAFLAWSEFQKNPKGNEYDIALHRTSGFVNNARISADWVMWWINDGDTVRSQLENFKGGHALYMIRNSKVLIGRCLQMLTYHRPDLKIDPRLYATFFIDQHTFAFERKAYIKTWIGAAVFIVIILLLIDCYTKYRFGYTLFLDWLILN